MTDQSKRWDDALQMPISPPAVLNLAHLQFLRYLGECGRLEHPAEGPSVGPAVGLIREAERVRGLP